MSNPAKSENQRYIENVKARADTLRGIANESETDARLHVKTQTDNYFQSLRHELSKHPKLACVSILLLLGLSLGGKPMATQRETQFNDLVCTGDHHLNTSNFDDAHIAYSDAREIADTVGMKSVVQGRWKLLSKARKEAKANGVQ